MGIIAITIAAKFVWPELMGTVAPLTYGRLRPLHVNGMLFGWLLAADMGLAFYIVPRLCGVKLWSEKLGVATAALWNVIILGAVVCLLDGLEPGPRVRGAAPPARHSRGGCLADVRGEHLHDHLARASTRRCTSRIWYIMGTIVWTAFVYLTGNFAVLFATGVNQANLNWMYVHNAVGLIFTPVGLAHCLLLHSQGLEHAASRHKLSMIGFWSLAFVYVWTGAHHMLHGPISQWLQTIAIAFSRHAPDPGLGGGLQLLRHHEGPVVPAQDSVPLKFLMSGVVFYLLTCFQGPMHSLRTVNAIVSKTDWIPGHAHMAVLGAFSFFAIAGTYYVVPRLWNRDLYSDALANWSYWLFMIGGLGFFVTLWLGGFWQGWQWNNPAIPFIDTVVALKPIWLVRFFSGILMFAGIVTFAYNVLATVVGAGEQETDALAAQA